MALHRNICESCLEKLGGDSFEFTQLGFATIGFHPKCDFCQPSNICQKIFVDVPLEFLSELLLKQAMGDKLKRKK